MPGAGMQISAHQGQQIGLLARTIGARLAIEVGTFTGYSSLCIAERCPPTASSNAATSAPNGRRSRGAIGRRPAGRADRAHHRARHPDARPAADAGLAGKVDLAFIDADKESYDAYYERCLKLVRSGGLILVDNVLWGGSVIDPADNDADTKAIRALNAKLKADDRIDLALFAVGDGMTCALKR